MALLPLLLELELTLSSSSKISALFLASSDLTIKLPRKYSLLLPIMSLPGAWSYVTFMKVEKRSYLGVRMDIT